MIRGKQGPHLPLLRTDTLLYQPRILEEETRGWSTMANDFDLANFTPEQLQTLLNGPALGPPTGVLPNFTNPPNENTLGYALLIACASLCAIMVGIRVYAKAVCLKKMDIEDCLCSSQCMTSKANL